MFERFTEKARRAIFCARYEAGQLGGTYIEAEHLLLGLAREDPALRGRINSADSLRQQVKSHTPAREKLSTSVDIPLSHDAKLVLRYAAEEAETLQHKVIDCGHLVLGLLRPEDSLAASLLRQQGIGYESYREIVSAAVSAIPRHDVVRPVDRPSAWHGPEENEPAAPSLGPAITALKGLLDRAVNHLGNNAASYENQHLKRKPWTRKEALGHLIDLATVHQQWVARALTEPRLSVTEYPPDGWVHAQQYRHFSWADAVDLWIGINRLLVHVLLLVPEEKMTLPVRIGVENPISFLQLIERYVEQSEDILGQILSRL